MPKRDEIKPSDESLFAASDALVEARGAEPQINVAKSYPDVSVTKPQIITEKANPHLADAVEHLVKVNDLREKSKLKKVPVDAFPQPAPGQVSYQGNPIIGVGEPTSAWWVAQWLIHQDSGNNAWVTIVDAGAGAFSIIEASSRNRNDRDPFDALVQAKHCSGTGHIEPDGISIQFDVNWGNTVGRYLGWWTGGGQWAWKPRGQTWDLGLGPNAPKYDWEAEETEYKLGPVAADSYNQVTNPEIVVEATQNTASANGWFVRLRARGFTFGESVSFWSLTTAGDVDTDWMLVDFITADSSGSARLPDPYIVYVPPAGKIEFVAVGETSKKRSPARGFDG